MIYTSFADTLFFFTMAIITNILISYLIALHFESKSLKRDSNILDLFKSFVEKSMLEEVKKGLKGFLEFLKEDSEDSCDCDNCEEEKKEEKKEEVKKEPVRRKPRVGDIVNKVVKK